MIEKKFEVNSNKNNIKCKIYENNLRNINHIILSIHGFGGNKDNSVTRKLAEDLIERYDDVAVISFDLPCHGNDVKQKIDLNDCDNYLDIMVNYIHEKENVNDIYVQATSFGGYLVLKYISEHNNPFTKIALRCPAINMYNLMLERILTKEQLLELAKRKDVECGKDRKIKITDNFLLQLKENNILKRDYIDQSESILIMHGTKDELIDFEIDRKFCDDNIIEFIPI